MVAEFLSRSVERRTRSGLAVQPTSERAQLQGWICRADRVRHQHEWQAAATAQDERSVTPSPPLSDVTTDSAIEQKVVAFAEQLGRLAGTIQAKAEGWMSTDTLHRQIASIRDGAADLLEHLLSGSAKVAKKNPPAAARGRNKGRSGGVVDAPGKKHRPPVPTDPDAAVAETQAMKMRARSLSKPCQASLR
jgi:hypothetical protein